MTKEQIEESKSIEIEINTKTIDLRRVNDFLDRDQTNNDTALATKNGKIFVKFAGTGCFLPTGIFNGAMRKQKKDLEDELLVLEAEFAAL